VSRVVVIGAGMGGLATAARLAKAGHRVTLVEASDRVGGKLASYARDGYVVDTGPSLLTLPAVYRDLFLSTAPSRRGAALEDNVELVAVDPAFGYRFADGSSVTVPNATRGPALAAALDAGLGPGTGAQWNALVDRGAAMWSVTRGPFLTAPLRPATLGRLALHRRDVATVAPWLSLSGLARHLLDDPRLVMMAQRYATYTGSDPDRAPAALATIPYLEATFGAWHIRGGLGRLADATAQRCVALGVDLRLGCAVTQVRLAHGRATGVALRDGSHVAADLVVANVDATSLYQQLLPAGAGGRVARRLRRATPSLAGFTLLAGVRGRSGLGHHSVSFPADYAAEFRAIFGPDPRPAPDPALYVCVPDDPEMRPDAQHESWFVLANAPRHDPGRGVDWRAPGAAERYAHHLLDVLATRGTDIRDRLDWLEWRTPADLQDAAGAPGGSIYGTASHGVAAPLLRPANTTSVRGLLAVGGSVHPGGGLPLVGLSAEIVAGLVGPA